MKPISAGPLQQIAILSACAALALPLAPARAQIAPGNGPIDFTADQLELVDAQHLAIWKGNVQVVQNGNRLVADVLNVYYTGRPAQPGAPAAPAAPAKSAATPTSPTTFGSTWGDVDHLVADGHVFYVSPEQTARGDHALYEAAPDTITMTGEVVVVQGQNVVKGDKLIIDVKTNHANLVSNVQGRNHPERVRGVFYNSGNASPATGGAPAAGAAKPAK